MCEMHTFIVLLLKFHCRPEIKLQNNFLKEGEKGSTSIQHCIHYNKI